jgi:glycosyltransferase involved in cell wall biosynthesis
MKKVYFHRDYHGFRGGHLKVWDYFKHVDAAEGYSAEIYFTPQSVWDDHNPWFVLRDRILPEWRPDQAEIVFLAGLDWLSIDKAQRHHFSRPVINLVQGLRHSDPSEARFAFLGHRAVRICVGPEVTAALRATGQVNGPIFTIPNGIDVGVLPEPMPHAARRYDLLIVGLKAPLLAAELASVLEVQYPTMRLLSLTEPVPRNAFLETIRAARTALLLPDLKEGFYLPAVEAMILRTLVLCPDVGGNRAFCRDGETAIVPARYELSALLAAINRVGALGKTAREALITRAAKTAALYSLSRERAAFHDILTDIRQIW